MENEQLTTLSDFMSSYTGGKKTTKNVCELAEVSINYVIKERTGKDSTGMPFNYHVVIFNGEDYRIPSSMLEALKENLKIRPDMKKFKVVRKGTTKDDTKYTFIGL